MTIPKRIGNRPSRASATQERELSYYNLTAPFAGVIGDIPVHIGDYVSPQTLLTTLTKTPNSKPTFTFPPSALPIFAWVFRCRSSATAGEPIETTKIYFISEQVDNATQGILVKAPIHSSLEKFRTSQLVKARVIWSTAPTPTVPVLAVTRIGGQSFVYVAVARKTTARSPSSARSTLGDTVGNDYAVLGGLKPGDKVIVSGTQFLIDGAPVRPIS